MFTMRTSKPANNKYYIRKVNGGWNGAVLGKPTDAKANVLSNCVGYANGRFAEIQDLGYIKYQLVCNAERFVEQAKKYGLTISDKPTLGGIMVWQRGATLNGSDGAGHVAVVEKIINDNTIYTSESSYDGRAFFNATRSNSNGRWGLSSVYKFLGCIVNPAVKEEKKSIDEIAKEVIAGKWGNGNARKTALKNAGYDPTEVQQKVNELMHAETPLKVGDNVKAILSGKASSNGTGKTARANIKGTITKIAEGAAYPYLISKNKIAIGWYKANALEKV